MQNWESASDERAFLLAKFLSHCASRLHLPLKSFRGYDILDEDGKNPKSRDCRSNDFEQDIKKDAVLGSSRSEDFEENMEEDSVLGDCRSEDFGGVQEDGRRPQNTWALSTTDGLPSGIQIKHSDINIHWIE